MTTATDNTSGTGQGAQPARRSDAEQRIYASIRHAVLTQRLHAGARLPELTLSQIYGINRSVVRRALVRLAGDHVIVMRRNQSATIANPTPAEAAQLFAARRHVEAQVMRDTAGQLSHGARAALERTVAAEHRAHDAHNQEERIHLSLRFHQELADGCPNQVLATILHELIVRTSITVALYKVAGMAACYRCQDHRGIADAVFSGDGERAARLACDHLDYLESRLNYTNEPEQPDLGAILGGSGTEPVDAAG